MSSKRFKDSDSDSDSSYTSSSSTEEDSSQTSSSSEEDDSSSDSTSLCSEVDSLLSEEHKQNDVKRDDAKQHDHKSQGDEKRDDSKQHEHKSQGDVKRDGSKQHEHKSQGDENRDDAKQNEHKQNDVKREDSKQHEKKPVVSDSVISAAGGASSKLPKKSFFNAYSFLISGNNQDVPPGGDVIFALNTVPTDDIYRVSASGILMTNPGSYFVFYQVTALGAGHLLIALNGVEQLHTIVSKTNTIQQLVCGTIITTVEPNTILTIKNPQKATSTLRLTSSEGGTLGVTNHLTILAL